jgi:hypothetical protein
MAWERRGKAYFYYRSVWANGRTEKRYFGRGPVGELADYFDDMARRRERSRSEALRAEVARLGPAEAALGALEIACSLIVGATLTAAGFHRPKLGPWRRRARFSS